MSLIFTAAEYARFKRQTSKQQESMSWRCKKCRRPSYLMFFSEKPPDRICTGCRIRLKNGLPIERMG